MSFSILTTYPDLAQTQTVTLGGKTLEITFQWLPRLGGWYADVFDAESGDAIALRRRLSVGSDLVENTLDVPGYLVPFGDPAGTFGTDFIVMWISDD